MIFCQRSREEMSTAKQILTGDSYRRQLPETVTGDSYSRNVHRAQQTYEGNVMIAALSCIYTDSNLKREENIL